MGCSLALLDPLAARAGACACGCAGRASIGAAGGLYVSDAEVKAKKRQVDLDINNLRLTVEGGTCGLSFEEAESFYAFVEKWKAFYYREIPFWGAGEQMTEALDHEARARQWRELLASRCSVIGPDIPAPKEEPQSLPAQWIGMLKVGLPAVALVAAAVVVAPLVWEYAAERKAVTRRPRRA